MARVILALVTVLALIATSVAVWAAVSLASPVTDASGETREHRDSTATVARFYAAVTESLQTARTDPMRDVITPAFTVHGPGFPDSVGLAAFDQVLQSLRDVCPTCVVTVDAVVVDAGAASVLVTGRTTEVAAVIGLPITGALVVWTAHDRLRIENGRIADYWHRVAPLPTPNPLAGALFLTLSKTGVAQVGVTHLSVQPGAHTGQALTPTARHIVVEAGVLSVGIGRAPSAENESDTPPVQYLDTVGPGEHSTIPAHVRLALGNDGAAPVSAWVIAVRPSIVNVAEDAAWLTIESETGDRPAGVRQRFVAAAIVAGAPGGQCTLALARFTLAPEASIGAHAVAGTELFSIGAGELVVTAAGGQARVVHGQDPAVQEHPETAGSGEPWQDTAVLNGGHVTGVRNTAAAPVDLIALVIAPSIPNQSAS